jgi:hypothetical protein
LVTGVSLEIGRTAEGVAFDGGLDFGCGEKDNTQESVRA